MNSVYLGLLILSICEVGFPNIILEHQSTVYVPIGQDPVTFGYNAEACEQSAIDARQPIVYAAGGNLLHVIDFSDASSPEIVHYLQISDNPNDGAMNDVEACEDWIAVGYSSFIRPLEGRVFIFQRYNEGDILKMRKVHDIIVGATPDSLKFTSGCSKVLVVIEGELANNNGTIVDPEGGITIVEFQGSIPGKGDPEVTFVNFTSFNDVADNYIQKGVRKVYNGQGTSDINGTTFSQDLEPENLALNYDESLAYITLQENNAIAILDIESKSFIDIFPMGYRDYSKGNEKGNRLDPSDKDGGAFIKNWGDGVHGLYGMYQADSIKYITFEGRAYVLTANEGDSKEYEDMGLDKDWSETMRGRDLVKDGLISPNVSQEIIAMLNDDAQLGRLAISIVDGLDNEGKIHQFWAYGGRNIAAYRVEDISLAWDSRDDLEQRINFTYPEVFNANARDEDIKPEQTFDTRSDNRGPEPEALDYGIVNGKTVIFVGLERPGMIAIYSVVPETDLELQFESITYSGQLGDTWYKLWAERRSRDLEPEDVRFLKAERSPTGNDMLIVTASVSGTISFYDIIDTEKSASNIGIRNNYVIIQFIMAFYIGLLMT